MYVWLKVIFMVYSIKEYAETFSFNGKHFSRATILTRIKLGLLPSNHRPKKLEGRHGAWIIEVVEK